MAETTNTTETNAGNNNGGNTNNNGKTKPVDPPYKDNDGNEIKPAAKFFAGLFLILLTAFTALYLIAHWPDRLVAPRDNIKPLYTYKWFHVRLAGIPDTGKIQYLNDSIVIVEDYGLSKIKSSRADTTVIPDSLKKNAKKLDSLRKHNDSVKAQWKEQNQNLNQSSPGKSFSEKNLIHINTLLLILVAIAGFLGNLIYVASSFTTFVGNGQFKKSWALWYFVKPFTASALALAIYFVFRGGFLNMSDDSTNINLYGLMTISILAGLFTDRTTLKLKEVFDVLLKPSEERAHPLNETEITDVKAEPLETGKPITVTINGKNLDKKTIIIKVEGQTIQNLDKQSSAITFSYTLPSELKDKDSLKLEIVDDKNASLHAPFDLKVKKESVASSPNATGQPSNTNDENQKEFGNPDSPDNTNAPKD